MSSHNTVIPEVLKTSGRVLFNGKTTGTAAEVGILPAKVSAIYITAIVLMANAADLTLTVKTADDAAGTNTTALTDNVPVFVNDVKQTAAKGYAVTAASGTFVVVFCVPSILVPTDKYVGLHFANSNAANILSAIAIEDTYYNG